MVSQKWTKLLLIALLLSLLPLSSLPVAAQQPARADTLIIAVPGVNPDPTNLNIYAPGVSRSDTGLHQLVYEYFFYQNLQTGEYVPWLAESYKYNADYTNLTVKLRKGVQWSDGQPFTADDVTFTYDLLAKNAGMTWSAESQSNFMGRQAEMKRGGHGLRASAGVRSPGRRQPRRFVTSTRGGRFSTHIARVGALAAPPPQGQDDSSCRTHLCLVGWFASPR